MYLATTVSGRGLSLLEPNPDDVQITDIAHSLSQINRFNGNTAWGYSVATHSLQAQEAVASIGGSAVEQLEALMHDAAEAYVGDISTPVKALLGDKFRDIEGRVMDAILRRFRLSGGFLLSDKMRDIDQCLAQAERNILIRDADHWLRGDSLEVMTKHGARCRAVDMYIDPERAERRFLDKFNELRLAIN